MRWAFWRKPGKHDLGAAVTSIPSLPATPVVPASYGAFAHPPEPVPGPRVELGFRDGTALALSPESEQAKALSDIAQVLTQRD